MATPILTYSPGGGTTRSAPAVLDYQSGETLTEPGTPILNYAPSGGVPPGGSSYPGLRQGYLFYWPQIENLTGGYQPTDLDAQNISGLPADSLIIVCIDSRGESHWLRVQNATSPVTDLNAGKITPTNYDASLRPYVLYRQLGF